MRKFRRSVTCNRLLFCQGMTLNDALWGMGTDNWALPSTASAPQPTLFSALKSEILILSKSLKGSFNCFSYMWMHFVEEIFCWRYLSSLLPPVLSQNDIRCSACETLVFVYSPFSTTESFWELCVCVCMCVFCGRSLSASKHSSVEWKNKLSCVDFFPPHTGY